MDTIVKELRECAATLSRIADTLVQATEPEANAFTLEEVRKVLAGLSQSGTRPCVLWITSTARASKSAPNTIRR